APLPPPQRPSGPLDADTLAAAVAAAQPEGAIVVDEGVTSTRGYFDLAGAAAPHTYLVNTGGAIGHGMPLATGAAFAAPERAVISLEADGSGMYTLQALWTQAREGLDVTTVVCANRSYRILQAELLRAGAAVGTAAAGLTHLDSPALDWVHLARGMGLPATRAATAEDLTAQLAVACAEPGPHLVEAVLET
ncbi:MAG: thiamine pyrophosphate-dependent enzyme, partial [Streptomycetales bacterium]